MLKHVILLNIVGLETSHIEKNFLSNISELAKEGEYSSLDTVFPAVTCTTQNSLLSGSYPSEHGIISNGLFDRKRYEVSFWEQNSSLVCKPRIFDLIKNQDDSIRTAMLFWQNSLHANSDIIITPKPLHFDDGMVMWCYSKPNGYYEKLAEEIGEFNLSTYWGPFASPKSSQWIINSTISTIKKYKPNLLMSYIPHIDYSAQRFGKNSTQVREDLKHADNLVGDLIETCKQMKIYDQTRIIIFSDYGFNNVTDAIPINKILRNNNLLFVRTIKNKEYLDLENSIAFAMADHQIAHIYINPNTDDSVILKVKNLLENISGIEFVLDKKEKQIQNIDHERSGDLIAVSNNDKWFSYYWWYEDEKAPNFTKTVDIHRKPGYDPLELFLDPVTKTIPYDASLIKGSHGRPSNIFPSDNNDQVYISNQKSGLLDKNGSNIGKNSSINLVDLGKDIINLF